MFKKNNPGCGCSITAVNVGVCQALVTWNTCVPTPNSVSINTGTTTYNALPNTGSMVVNGLGPFTLTVTDCFGNIVCTATELFRCSPNPSQSGIAYSGQRFTLAIPGNYHGIPDNLLPSQYSGSSVAIGGFPRNTGPCTNPPFTLTGTNPFYFNTYDLAYVDIVSPGTTYVFDAPYLTVDNCKPFLTPISPAINAGHVHAQWVYDWEGKYFDGTTSSTIDSGSIALHMEYDILIDTIDGTPYFLPLVLRKKNTNYNYYITGTYPANSLLRIGGDPFHHIFYECPPHPGCPPIIPCYNFDSDNDTVKDSWSDIDSIITGGTLIPC